MDNCKHYIRKCFFYTPCCNKIYKCRFCHDAAEGDHELDRSLVFEIVCSQCNLKQPLSTHCRGCDIRFGMYTCLECRLFDDTDKKQFHCDKCGVCRVGGRDNFFHCDICDICLQKSLQKHHKCRVDSGKDRCPVCFEGVHTSSDSSYVPECGHLIHSNCYKMILKFNHSKCPLCFQSYTPKKVVSDDENNNT